MNSGQIEHPFASLFQFLAVAGAVHVFMLGAIAVLVLWLLAGLLFPALRDPVEERLLVPLSGIPLGLGLLANNLPPGNFPYASVLQLFYPAVFGILFGIAYLALAVTSRIWRLRAKAHASTSPKIRAVEATGIALTCTLLLYLETYQDLGISPHLTLAGLLAGGIAIDVLWSKIPIQTAGTAIHTSTSYVRAPPEPQLEPTFAEATIEAEAEQRRRSDESLSTTPAPSPDTGEVTMSSSEPTTAFAAKLPAVPDIPKAGPARRMLLKLRRAQRSGLTGKVIFTLDARMQVPDEERRLVEKYRLGGLVIYDSTSRQKHAEATKAHLERTKEMPGYRENLENQLLGTGKTLFRFARAGISAAMAGLSLRVTVASLMKGVHVECKSMDELLGAEHAIVEAGENLRTYLETAESFDGREVVLEF